MVDVCSPHGYYDYCCRFDLSSLSMQVLLIFVSNTSTRHFVVSCLICCHFPSYSCPEAHSRHSPMLTPSGGHVLPHSQAGPLCCGAGVKKEIPIYPLGPPGLSYKKNVNILGNRPATALATEAATFGGILRPMPFRV